MTILVLDETRLKTTVGQLIDELNGLSKLIKYLRAIEVNIPLYKHDDVWWAEVADDLQLQQVIFDRDSLLDIDLKNLLMRQIDQLISWNGQDDAAAADSVTYVQGEIANSNPAACIVIPEHDTAVETDGKSLHFIGKQSRVVDFARDASELGNFSEAEFMEMSKIAFPELHFREGVERGIAKFSLSFRGGMRRLLTQALSALNDALPAALVQTKNMVELPKLFAPSGFEISPESPNTHRNKSAMEERDVEFGNIKIRCEWHLKIHATVDRIHFYFGKQDISKKPILIGIFCDHLTT